MDDVAASIRLDKTSGRSTNGATHVGDEETTVAVLVKWIVIKRDFAKDAPFGLSTDLIRNGAENGTVAVSELGVVRVAGVPVVGGILGLQQRQQATTDEGLAIEGSAQVVRTVSAAGHIRNMNDGTKGVLEERVSGGSAEGMLNEKWPHTSSRLAVTKKSLWWLSPAPVQK